MIVLIPASVEIIPWLGFGFTIRLMNVGNDAACRVGALARESETPEAGLPVFLIMTKAIVACGGLFDGRQVGRGNIETGAGAGVLV